jgi:hypothetical protein
MVDSANDTSQGYVNHEGSQRRKSKVEGALPDSGRGFLSGQTEILWRMVQQNLTWNWSRL